MAASTRTAFADGHKYLGAFVVVVALFSVSTSLHAQNLYGSMAFAQTGDGGYAWGIAWNAQGRSMARQLAIDECRWAGGGSGCREVGGFRNACGAIAIGDGDGYGTGWGDSSGEAERTAMNECRSQNNTCHIEISRCTELSAAVGIDRAARRRIQLVLAAQGFDPGPADGISGSRTEAALRAWQAAKGYAATGTLTSEQARILQLLQPRQAKASVKPAAAKKKAADLWGAIAFSQNPDRGHAWAIVWNSAGAARAKQVGLEVCRREGGESCREVGWFRNACGALAIGDENGFGAGWGATTTQAEQDALKKCRAANQDCRIEVSRCSDQPGEASGVAKASVQKESTVLEESTPDVNGHWLSLAVDNAGSRTAWGTGWGNDPRSAHQAATQECERQGGIHCTTGSSYKTEPEGCRALAFPKEYQHPLQSIYGEDVRWKGTAQETETKALVECEQRIYQGLVNEMYMNRSANDSHETLDSDHQTLKARNRDLMDPKGISGRCEIVFSQCGVRGQDPRRSEERAASQRSQHITVNQGVRTLNQQIQALPTDSVGQVPGAGSDDVAPCEDCDLDGVCDPPRIPGQHYGCQ